MNQNNTLPSNDQPYVVAAGDGEHMHFLNHLATTKVKGSGVATMAAVEFEAPRGFGPPLHLHDDDDELIVVLDGEIVFRSGERESTASAGGMAFLPRGIPHSFQVLSPSARFLSVTASTGASATFDSFVEELGEPLPNRELPAPIEIDGGRVASVGAKYAITTLGPPPAPLD